MFHGAQRLHRWTVRHWSAAPLPHSPLPRSRLAVQATEEASSAKTVQVQIKAFNLENQPVADIALQSDLFFVVTKTVKEQVAPFVYRYRNTDQFTKIASQELKGSGTIHFDAPQTGRYVVAVSAPGVRTPLVSDETTITGEEPAELPVENETSFQIEQRAEPFVPGETAVLTTKAPFPGIAWVSIETDKILDTFLVPIPGNAGRIEIPIKDDLCPECLCFNLSHPSWRRACATARAFRLHSDRRSSPRLEPQDRTASSGFDRPTRGIDPWPDCMSHPKESPFPTLIWRCSWSMTPSCNSGDGNCPTSLAHSITSALSESKATNRSILCKKRSLAKA